MKHKAEFFSKLQGAWESVSTSDLLEILVLAQSPIVTNSGTNTKDDAMYQELILAWVFDEILRRRPDTQEALDKWVLDLEDERTQAQVLLEKLSSVSGVHSAIEVRPELKTDKDYGHEARELELYIMNDLAVHRAYLQPCLKSLQRLHERGEFYRDKALRSLSRVVNGAAKQYALEYGSMTTKWSEMFPKGDRDRVAEKILDDFLAELREGNSFWE
jgi:hypothetical protein